MESPPRARPLPKLACLLGAEPPESLADELASLLNLPESARAEFWQVLMAYLRPELDPSSQSTIVDYCTRHELPSQRIAPVVRATRFLFEAAARAHLGPSELAADIELLVPESAEPLTSLLVPWFDDLAPQVRRRALEETIADHGKVALGTTWRIDRILASQRGRDHAASVAVLTFRYREGTREDRVTLQFLPEELAELRKTIDGIFGVTMSDTNRTGPTLACLDGEDAPRELVDALRKLDDLPEGARAQLDELLGQLLDALPDDQLDARIGRLCRRLELAPEVAGPALKALRVVLRAAAAMDLDRAALARDLDAMLGRHPSELLDIYDRVRPALREELIQSSIAGHGRVLVGMEWRIDTLGSSNRGRRLNVPVALMTFHVRHVTQTEHMTIQLTPQMVRQLRDVCNQLLK